MTPAELEARRSEVQMVDVRWPNEWDAGRIEGAWHIPQDELEDRLGEIDRGRPVVTVCRTGARSAAAADLLRAEGFDAESLDGGMQAWAADGLSVTTPDGAPGAVVEPEPPPDDRPVEHQRLQSEFMSLLLDIQEHFGEREPSDEEIRAFLRQRLIEEGRSPEEADGVLVGRVAPVRGQLTEFLATSDLERLAELAGTIGDLDEDEDRAVRDALAGGGDDGAVANLRMYPEVIPEDMRVDALADALHRPSGDYLMLAAVVGAGRLASGSLTADQRRRVSGGLAALLAHPNDDVACRASAALIPRLGREDVDVVIPYLGDRRSVVRHNVLAALLRVLDPPAVASLVEQAAAAGRIERETAAEVDQLIEHGTLDKKTLVLRRVMAPLLTPLPER